MKKLLFFIIPAMLFSAEYTIKSDGILIDGEEYYSSEAGVMASITYYFSGPITGRSLKDIMENVAEADSGYVRGYEWKDKKDKFKYKKLKKKDLVKHKHLDKKDKKDKKDKDK